MEDETNLNRKLHLALGRCDHTFNTPPFDDDESLVSRCQRCGETAEWLTGLGLLDLPDYCSDLNLCAEAEKEVIERVGGGRWMAELRRVVRNEADAIGQTLYVPAATAEQRVAAMLAALEALGSKEKL